MRLPSIESAAVIARDLCGLIGAGLIGFGIWSIYWPLGLIAVGLMMLGGSILIARR